MKEHEWIQLGDLSEEQWTENFGKNDFMEQNAEIIADLKEKVAGKSQLEAYSLQSCLESCDEESLKNLAEQYNLTSISNSDLAQAIIQRYNQFLDCMMLEDYFDTVFMLEQDDKEVPLNMEETKWYFFSQGFLFLQRNETQDNPLKKYLRMPIELQQAFCNKMDDQWMQQIESRDLPYHLIKGLCYLYGIYPTEQLEAVWKTSLQQENSIPEDILTTCHQYISMGRDELGYADGYYFMQALEGFNQKDVLLERGKNYTYYMPNMDEIMEYCDYGFAIPTSEYIAVTEAIREHKNVRVKDLMEEICTVLTLEETLNAAWNCMADYGFKVNSQKTKDRYTKLLNRLSSVTRKWIYRGNRAMDLDPNMFVKTVRYDTPKVGRNDPCPCGSGKKYKQCCGK